MGFRVCPVYPDVVIHSLRVPQRYVAEDILSLFLLPASEVSGSHGEAGALLQATGAAVRASRLLLGRDSRSAVDTRIGHPGHFAFHTDDSLVFCSLFRRHYNTVVQYPYQTPNVRLSINRVLPMYTAMDANAGPLIWASSSSVWGSAMLT